MTGSNNAARHKIRVYHQIDKNERFDENIMSYIDALGAKLRRAANYPIGSGVVPPQFKNTTRDVMECSADSLRAFRRNAAMRSLSEYEASRYLTH